MIELEFTLKLESDTLDTKENIVKKEESIRNLLEEKEEIKNVYFVLFGSRFYKKYLKKDEDFVKDCKLKCDFLRQTKQVQGIEIEPFSEDEMKTRKELFENEQRYYQEKVFVPNIHLAILQFCSAN